MNDTRTQRARALRKNQTDAERRLWGQLRLCQMEGHKFRRQFPLERYIVDFVCLERRLIVEVDGGQHNITDAQYDERRDAWLKAQGFRVLRFWNNQVLAETAAVLEAIAVALSLPPSQPSPVKGEGEKS